MSKACTECGTTENLTRHHVNGKHNGEPNSTVLLCRPCHDRLHEIECKRSAEKQRERLLKRSMRFTERSLKLIRQDKRWVHIADQWTEAEKKEMSDYLIQKANKVQR